MKRPTHLPARDLELLSAYIDGALPAAQAARLESRLKEDMDLRTALEEIRVVALALRKLPPVPLPRDFTLRGADVPARRPAAYPVLSLATALATLAFIVVFGLDTWAQGFSFGAGAPLAAEPGAPEGQALEVGPSMAERAADMGEDVTPTPPAESLMAGSSPATPPYVSPSPTPTVTPTPAEKEFDGGLQGLDLVDRLKIGFGVLALGLASVTLIVRRRRS
ncbi:MAG: hypothetical protein WD906_02775 [Anaerolineales bacterium]